MPRGSFVTLDDRGVLALGGPDVRNLLQGLVSNDVGRLSPKRAIYAALLTPQGKYLHDFVMFEHEGRILLDVEAARREDLLQRLTMYRLRAKVTIEDLSDGWLVAALPDPAAATSLDLASSPGAATTLDGGVAAVDPRLAELGVRALLPKDRAAEILTRLGLDPAPAETYQELRLRLGVPTSPRDLVPQRSLLLESNFDELHGVAFDKGCFVGQELTARTKHRALVRKRLLPVRIDGPCPEPGTPLLRDGRDAGEMRSALGEHGMALLRLELIGGPGDAPPTLTAGDSRVTPEWPAWLRPSPTPGG